MSTFALTIHSSAPFSTISGKSAQSKLVSTTTGMFLVFGLSLSFFSTSLPSISPEKSNISVVVLSNLGQEEDIEKAKKLGAVDYLVKAELSVEDVLAKVKSSITPPTLLSYRLVIY